MIGLRRRVPDEHWQAAVELTGRRQERALWSTNQNHMATVAPVWPRPLLPVGGMKTVLRK